MIATPTMEATLSDKVRARSSEELQSRLLGHSDDDLKVILNLELPTLPRKHPLSSRSHEEIIALGHLQAKAAEDIGERLRNVGLASVLVQPTICTAVILGKPECVKSAIEIDGVLGAYSDFDVKTLKDDRNTMSV